MLGLRKGGAHKRAIYDGECARLVDPLTGNTIYNAAELDGDVTTNITAFEERYGVQFHDHTLAKMQKAIKCTGRNQVAPAFLGTKCGRDLYNDEMPSGKQIRRTTEAMLQFPTNLHLTGWLASSHIHVPSRHIETCGKSTRIFIT